MTQIKKGFLDLEHHYLFQETARRVAAFRESHPGANLIALGIGDVTRPLAPAVIRQGLSDAGLKAFGGENAPYVWVREAMERIKTCLHGL
ncbi:MAG: hypothetical protein IJ654_02785 [Bacteroidales bacterium]|nr:hypothetical protein [Bacteroidales bacterium]